MDIYIIMTYNGKSWMTQKITSTWLEELNQNVKTQNRKILLFMDNAASHPQNITILKNVDIAFFLPNVTTT